MKKAGDFAPFDGDHFKNSADKIGERVFDVVLWFDCAINSHTIQKLSEFFDDLWSDIFGDYGGCRHRSFCDGSRSFPWSAGRKGELPSP